MVLPQAIVGKQAANYEEFHKYILVGSSNYFYIYPQDRNRCIIAIATLLQAPWCL